MSLISKELPVAARVISRGDRLLLRVTMFSLPFSYVPHEIIRTGPSMTPVLIALVIVCAARFGHLGRVRGIVDGLTLVFAAFVVVRLLVLAPLQGYGAYLEVEDVTRAAGTLVSGLLLYRMGRDPRLSGFIISDLRIVALLLAGIALYQQVVGLDFLQGLGYSDGFYYFTESGTFRPFGTFLSPTVFAAYLGLLGVAVISASRGVFAAVLLVAVGAALVLTQTRAAWIAFVVSLAIVLLNQSPIARRRVILASVPAAFVIAFVVLADPSLFSQQASRLATLSDSNYTSNNVRLDLWAGTLRAAAQSPLIGYAPADFAQVMQAYVGDLAAYGHAHDNYLQILYLYGGIGLGLFLAVFVFTLRGLRRSLISANRATRALSLAAIGSVSFFLIDSLFETTWTSLNVVSTVFLIVGLGTGHRHGDGTSFSSRADKHRADSRSRIAPALE